MKALSSGVLAKNRMIRAITHCESRRNLDTHDVVLPRPCDSLRFKSGERGSSETVGGFVAGKALHFNKIQQSSITWPQTIQSNHLKTTKIYRLQQVLGSGSGPGSRRFIPMLRDYSPRPIASTSFHFESRRQELDYIRHWCAIHANLCHEQHLSQLNDDEND